MIYFSINNTLNSKGSYKLYIIDAGKPEFEDQLETH